MNPLQRSNHLRWSPPSPERHLHHIDENGSPDKHRRSSIPIKMHKSRSSKAALSPRRSASGIEASKYIEHLESQLAALQTQLTSLTSPSQTRHQSTKLRALNAESQLLRQEVTEWELKFNERIEEHVEQHNILIEGLRAHIRSLERSNDEQQSRITELAADCEERSSYAERVESANYELERRLEFMSELLATSPSKLDLHHSTSPVKPMRPRSVAAPRLNTNVGPLSPERSSKRMSRSIVGFGFPSSPRGAQMRSDSRASDMSSIEHILSQSLGSQADVHDGDLNDDDDGDAVDDTLIETPATIDKPTRTLSWMRPKLGENLAQSPPKSRPSRKMRRFYTGSMGPRALILPATTHAGSQPISAPVVLPDTPCPASRGRPTRHSMSDFPLLREAESPQLPSRPLHRRVATWDVDDMPSSQRRVSDSSSMLALTYQSNLSASIERIRMESERSQALRALSSDSVKGENLEDELARMRRESSVFSTSRPGTMHGSSSARQLMRVDQSLTLAQTAEEAVVDSNLTLYAEFPHGQSPRSQSPGQALVRRRGNVFTLMNIICVRTIDIYTMNARRLFRNAWSSALLSRPVVEFRVWLIRVLLSGLHKKRLLDARIRPLTGGRREPPLQLMSSPTNSMLEELGGPGHTEESTASSETDGPHRPSLQPSKLITAPVNWLKFSVTLVFALGIAIKDGPSSLFGTKDCCEDALVDWDVDRH